MKIGSAILSAAAIVSRAPWLTSVLVLLVLLDPPACTQPITGCSHQTFRSALEKPNIGYIHTRSEDRCLKVCCIEQEYRDNIDLHMPADAAEGTEG